MILPRASLLLPLSPYADAMILFSPLFSLLMMLMLPLAAAAFFRFADVFRCLIIRFFCYAMLLPLRRAIFAIADAALPLISADIYFY